jgi:hypothetical protein
MSAQQLDIYTTRHPGRDCRDPEAMDGNAKSDHKSSHWELLSSPINRD